MEVRTWAWSVVFLVGLLFAECPAAAPKSVAGRSLAEWSAELDAKSRTRRLRAALTLPSFGVDAVKPLVKALEHDDPGVVYWAASGLGDLAHKSAHTKPVLRRLKGLMGHKAVGVRLSAAYASVCWPRGWNILIVVWPVRRPIFWLASGRLLRTRLRHSRRLPSTRTTTSRGRPTKR